MGKTPKQVKGEKPFFYHIICKRPFTCFIIISTTRQSTAAPNQPKWNASQSFKTTGTVHILILRGVSAAFDYIYIT